MAIDKLGPAAGIFAALRTEVGKRTERKDGKRAEASATQEKSRRDPALLRQQLADLVKAVDPNDAPAVKAVRPQVVRTILLWEFGSKLREHPEWQPMLESIVQTLEAQTEHQSQFLQLLSELKR